MKYSLFVVIAVVVVSFAALASAQDSHNGGAQAAEQPDASAAAAASAGAAAPTCGTPATDYAPCMAKERADALFKQCCQQYAPDGCQSLCQYETDELAARNLLLQAVKSSKCDLKHMSTVLYCASQNQNNSECCRHLNLADAKLGVGNRCLRFCDPAGKGGIASISRSDVTCLFNWNVLMYCHHSGVKIE